MSYYDKKGSIVRERPFKTITSAIVILFFIFSTVPVDISFADASGQNVPIANQTLPQPAGTSPQNLVQAEQNVQALVDQNNNINGIVTTYYPSGRIQSQTLSTPDSQGMVYYHYLDENWNGSGIGRMDKSQRQTASNGELTYAYTYYQDSTGRLQTKKAYSDSNYSALVQTYIYYDDPAGRLYANVDGLTGNVYTYYNDSTNYISTVILGSPDAQGMTYYYYMNENWNSQGHGRVIRSRRQTASNGELTYAYTYYQDSTGRIQTKTTYSDFSWTSLIAVYIYYNDSASYISSKTLSTPDAQGMVYYHYLDESWNSQGYGRVDSQASSTADANGATAYKYAYFTGTSTVQYKYCYQNASYSDPANPTFNNLLKTYEYNTQGQVIDETLGEGIKLQLVSMLADLQAQPDDQTTADYFQNTVTSMYRIITNTPTLDLATTDLATIDLSKIDFSGFTDLVSIMTQLYVKLNNYRSNNVNTDIDMKYKDALARFVYKMLNDYANNPTALAQVNLNRTVDLLGNLLTHNDSPTSFSGINAAVNNIVVQSYLNLWTNPAATPVLKDIIARNLSLSSAIFVHADDMGITNPLREALLNAILNDCNSDNFYVIGDYLYAAKALLINSDNAPNQEISLAVRQRALSIMASAMSTWNSSSYPADGGFSKATLASAILQLLTITPVSDTNFLDNFFNVLGQTAGTFSDQDLVSLSASILNVNVFPDDISKGKFIDIFMPIVQTRLSTLPLGDPSVDSSKLDAVGETFSLIVRIVKSLPPNSAYRQEIADFLARNTIRRTFDLLQKYMVRAPGETDAAYQARLNETDAEYQARIDLIVQIWTQYGVAFLNLGRAIEMAELTSVEEVLSMLPEDLIKNLNCYIGKVSVFIYENCAQGSVSFSPLQYDVSNFTIANTFYHELGHVIDFTQDEALSPSARALFTMLDSLSGSDPDNYAYAYGATQRAEDWATIFEMTVRNSNAFFQRALQIAQSEGKFILLQKMLIALSLFESQNSDGSSSTSFWVLADPSGTVQKTPVAITMNSGIIASLVLDGKIYTFKYDSNGLLKDVLTSGTNYTYYPSGRIQSQTLSTPDAQGMAYYHYLDENWNGSGIGRVDKSVRQTALNGELSYTYTYYQDSTGRLRIKNAYSDSGCNTLVNTYIYYNDPAGRLYGRIDGLTGNVYTYYNDSTNYISTVIFGSPDAQGMVYYYYMDENWNGQGYGRVIRSRRQTPVNGERAYSYTYYQDSTGRVQTKTVYSDFSSTNLVAVYAYYNDSTGYISSKTLSAPDAQGMIYYHYLDENWNGSGIGRVDKSVRQTTLNGELSYVYSYFTDSTGRLQMKRAYSNAIYTNLVRMYTYYNLAIGNIQLIYCYGPNRKLTTLYVYNSSGKLTRIYYYR